MIFVLTTAGQAAVSASPGVPVVLAGYTLGSSFGYAPNVAQTAIVGTAQNSGVPSLPIISSNNLVKYVTRKVEADFTKSERTCVST